MGLIFVSDLMKMACEGCGKPADQHEIVFNSRCHGSDKMRVTWIANNKSLRITCSKCNKLVCEVAVEDNSGL